MAFLRFTRDKRGYEQFAIVEPTTNRRGVTRPRVLYVFRTPPDIKVGREPFDEAARRSLEAQYPEVSFDWRKIVETPIPSADAERWRERRRAERAARQAAVSEAASEGAPSAESDAPDGAGAQAPVNAPEAGAAEVAVAVAAAPSSGDGQSQRRRRRRRRGHRGTTEAPAGGTAPLSSSAPAAPEPPAPETGAESTEE